VETVIQLYLYAALWLAAPFASNGPAVHVEPPDAEGTRQLQKQTAEAVVRDYLHSWQTMQAAFAHNDSSLLDQDFAGNALDELTETIGQQAELGLRTHYEDRTHDLRIEFYSPDGLSIRLIDNVTYEQQVLDTKKTLGSAPVQTRYLVILTPTEVRWKVRVFQAE
jgi:hypothetical protein